MIVICVAAVVISGDEIGTGLNAVDGVHPTSLEPVFNGNGVSIGEIAVP